MPPTGQRNAIDGRIVEIIAEVDRDQLWGATGARSVEAARLEVLFDELAELAVGLTTDASGAAVEDMTPSSQWRTTSSGRAIPA